MAQTEAPVPHDDAEGVAPGVAIGQALSQAREAQRLTLDDVANQIKFSTRQIEALEGGQLAELPSGPFVRGMIRSYARLLNLDPETLLLPLTRPQGAADADRIVARLKQPVPFADGSKRSNVTYVLFSVAALVVAAFVAWQWRSASPHPVAAKKPVPAVEDAQRAEPQVRVEAAAVIAMPAPSGAPKPVPAKAAALPAGMQAGTGKPAAAQAPGVAVPGPVAPAKAIPGVSNLKPAQPSGAVIAASAGARRLVVRVAEEAWIEVKDSTNQVLVAQLLPGGTQRVLDGEPPFSLVVGNAHFVQILRDGKEVDLKPHIKVEVARFRLQ